MAKAFSQEEIPHYTEWKVGSGFLFPFDNGNYCLGSWELFHGNLLLLKKSTKKDFENTPCF